jgi:hypothetical protein
MKLKSSNKAGNRSWEIAIEDNMGKISLHRGSYSLLSVAIKA